MRYCFGDYELDSTALQLTKAGMPVPIEPQVFDLLLLLINHAGTLVTRNTLVTEIWGGRIVSESAISARIAAARKAVGDDGKAQRVIRTVARRGLMWVAELSQEGTAPAETDPEPHFDQRIRYTTSATGQAIAYAVTGSGPPVLLVSHLNSDIEAEWTVPGIRALHDALSLNCTLIRFDPVGTGQSDPTADRTEMTQMADDIGAVAQAVGVDRFALFSQSGGCKPALHFAADNPERITRLAIAGGYSDGRLLRRTDNTPDSLRTLMSEGWADPDSAFVRAFMLSYMPEGPLETVREVAKILQNASSTDYALAVRDASNIHSATTLLPQIACPTLILHARGDEVHPLSEARKLASGIAGAELAVFETANHLPMPGNRVWPDYIRTLTGFLAKG